MAKDDRKTKVLNALRDGLVKLVELFINILEGLFEIIAFVIKKITNVENLPAQGFNVKKLSSWYLQVDGWAEIIEGRADEAQNIRSSMIKHLEARMPDTLNASAVTAYPGIYSRPRRPYLVITGYAGTITTVYIDKHGSDVYASWRTFISPVINWLLHLVFVILSVMIATSIVENNVRTIWQTPNYESFPWWFVLVYLGLCLVTAFLGNVFEKNPGAYFFVQRTVFDLDDITAISLATHKSLLGSLDENGIDINKLRLKRSFSSGRKGEEI